MKQYIVWLRHRFEVTMQMVTVDATSLYEASCSALAMHPRHVVSKIYLKDDHEDD
jgi:hypothetical protein